MQCGVQVKLPPARAALYSAVAQLAVRGAVNTQVVCSSRTRRAFMSRDKYSTLLGMDLGTASNRLKKQIFLQMAAEYGLSEIRATARKQ